MLLFYYKTCSLLCLTFSFPFFIHHTAYPPKRLGPSYFDGIRKREDLKTLFAQLNYHREVQAIDVGKDVEMIEAAIMKRISTLRDILLGINERNARKIVSKINGLATKIREGDAITKPSLFEAMKKLESLTNSLCFTKFGDDFCMWLFSKLLITI